MRTSLLLASSLLVVSCTPAPAPLALADGCQPLLGGADCMLPYPSDFFRVADPSQPTGFRVELKPVAKVKTKTGITADPHQAFAADGFSPVNAIVTSLFVDVTDDGFVHLADDPEKSLSAATSHTLLVDPDGTPVAHFVDLDSRATDPLRRALILHPSMPLKDATRYTVFVFGVQSGGALAPTPEGFKRIRDGNTGGEAALQPQLDAWNQRIKPLAKKLGLTTTQLQLAWEFSTGSQENIAGDMLHVRDLTRAWLEAHTPEVTVTSVDDAPSDNVWKVVHGTVSMPLFTDVPDPGAKLNRGADGQVAQHGTSTFPFIAVVPNSVRDAQGVGGTFLYGHGFFGGFAELTGSGARNIAQTLGRTMVAAEWWGMATGDVGKVGDALLNHPANAMQFTDRVHQAFANWIVLSAAVERVFPTLDAFKRPATGPGGGGALAGQPYLAGDASHYVGISQGTILGVGMVSVNPFIKRAAFEVGGSNFTALMFRAQPFHQFLDLLEVGMTDPLDEQKYVASLQRQMDRIDPNTYTRYMQREVLAGNPSRALVLQVGLGDTEVPNLGSFLLARALGLQQLLPTPKNIWGLTQASGPVDAAFELYDFGYDADAIYRLPQFPSVDTTVHNGIRTLTPTLQQTAKLFDDGVVQHFCSDVCNPD
jgi:hypothetical protein